jgi:mono/diheme cytochrome c family protein
MGGYMRNQTSLLIAALILTSAKLAVAQQGDATAGKAVYAKSCATCHGADGTPKEAIAKALKVDMKHLGSPEVQARSDDALKKEVVEGVGKMKPVKGISDTDLSNVIAYIRTLATQ